MPCGARGLIRAVVGGLRSIGPGVRAEGRVGVGCLPWARGHEPGSSAEARPAVPGPGARLVAFRTLGFGAVGPGGDCASDNSGPAWTTEAGLGCGLALWLWHLAGQ